MRQLIVSSAVAAAVMMGGSIVGNANAATWSKPAPAAAAQSLDQTKNVRCYRNARRDGCGFGRYRTKRGNCRPC